jgi:hypothetical protein
MLTFDIDIIKQLETYWFIMIHYHNEYRDLQTKEFISANYRIYNPLNSLQNWLGVDSEREVSLLKNKYFYTFAFFFKRLKIKNNIMNNLYSELGAIKNYLHILDNDKTLPKLNKFKIKFNLEFRYLIIKNLADNLSFFGNRFNHKKMISSECYCL